MRQRMTVETETHEQLDPRLAAMGMRVEVMRVDPGHTRGTAGHAAGTAKPLPPADGATMAMAREHHPPLGRGRRPVALLRGNAPSLAKADGLRVSDGLEVPPMDHLRRPGRFGHELARDREPAVLPEGPGTALGIDVEEHRIDGLAAVVSPGDGAVRVLPDRHLGHELQGVKRRRLLAELVHELRECRVDEGVEGRGHLEGEPELDRPRPRLVVSGRTLARALPLDRELHFPGSLRQGVGEPLLLGLGGGDEDDLPELRPGELTGREGLIEHGEVLERPSHLEEIARLAAMDSQAFIGEPGRGRVSQPLVLAALVEVEEVEGQGAPGAVPGAQVVVDGLDELLRRQAADEPRPPRVRRAVHGLGAGGSGSRFLSTRDGASRIAGHLFDLLFASAAGRRGPLRTPTAGSVLWPSSFLDRSFLERGFS